MPAYLHPGVYIEELPSGVKPIEGVSTSTTAFVGYATKGPVGIPVLLFKLDDYVRRYGGIRDLGASSDRGDPMGFSVAALFQNGGTKAYVVRVAADTEANPLARAKGYVLSPGDADEVVEVTGVNEGTWADGLIVRFTPKPADATLFTLEVGREDDRGQFSALEFYPDVSFDHEAPRFVAAVVNDASEYVEVDLRPANGVTYPGPRPDGHYEVELVEGGDGEEPFDEHYAAVFTAFEKIRDISILCLPGKAWGGGGDTVIRSAVSHAEKMKNRMVIVDPPADEELVTEQDVTGLSLPTSSYSVLYYPWVRVANPYYDAENNPGAPVTVLVAPSGYAAGMWSKIDGRRGVWKAPAGVETALSGLSATRYTVEDAEQDQLNPLGVNALRKLPGFGTVIWGSRTLSTKANPEWRYVPVRRTAIFIEQSIYNGIQWAVFEPNDHRLWSSLRLNTESFMDGLFRSGAFQGEKASDAYFVRCGLGDTMTQDDIDRGHVIVIVGFAPLKPAEFVIVRIQQKVAQQ